MRGHKGTHAGYPQVWNYCTSSPLVCACCTNRIAFGNPESPPDHVFIGRYGELVAASFLRSAGAKVLRSNFKAGRRGELDFVCRHGDTLVACEVKNSASTALQRSGAHGRRPQAPPVALGASELVVLAQKELAAPHQHCRGLSCRPTPACRPLAQGCLSRFRTSEPIAASVAALIGIGAPDPALCR